MKSVYVCLLVFCATIAVAGCEGQKEGNSLANEGLTAEDFAKYEAELAAVTGAEDHSAEDEGEAAEVEATE